MRVVKEKINIATVIKSGPKCPSSLKREFCTQTAPAASFGRDHTGNKAHEGRGIAEDDRIDIDRKHLHEALLDRMGYDG